MSPSASMAITVLQAGDAAEASAFIARLQGDPASMIPFLSTEPATINQELAELAPPWIDTAIKAVDDDRLVGVVFAETNLERGRAWIHGPWVNAQYWDPVAETLVDHLLRHVIPASIRDITMSGLEQHRRLAILAEDHGLLAGDVNLVLGIERAQTTGRPALERLTDSYEEAVARLHDELFPFTYWSGRQLVDKAPSDIIVLQSLEANQLLGYVVAEAQAGPEGYIHFLGVSPNQRRRGIGRTLMMAAIGELLKDPEISQVFLSVDSTNGPATALYQSLGFTLAFATVGYRTPPSEGAQRNE